MTHEVLRREEANGIHRLVMTDGPNALNPTLMDALSAAVSELRDNSAPPFVLMSAHEVLFCPGWDLKILADADRSAVGEFLETFNRLIVDLFSYPGPTAAAINGHAVAGGCLLAMSCDLRVMAVGRPRIGLSELNLGVPVPAASLEMLRARLAPNVVEKLVVGGDGIAAERARDHGVVHRTSEAESVTAKTERELAKLSAKPRRAFEATKSYLFRESWRRMSASQPADDGLFLDCWFSSTTQERIKGMVDRLGSTNG